MEAEDRALPGDDEAFDAFLARHEGACRRYVWKRFAAQREAGFGGGEYDDLVADTVRHAFWTAYLRRAQHDPTRCSARTWVCAVAVRMLGQRLKKAARRSRLEASWSAEPTAPADVAYSVVLQDSVAQTLARMAPRQVRALWLCYAEGYSQREAAAVLQTSETAVHAALQRGRDSFRSAWTEGEAQDG